MRDEIRQCQCPDCLQDGEHPNKELHRQMNLLLNRLDEQQRRCYVALELKDLPQGRTRRPGAGRPPIEKKVRRSRKTCWP